MKTYSVQTTANISSRSPLFVAHLHPNIYRPGIPTAIKQISRGDDFLQKITAVVNENIDEADLGIARICEAMHLSYMQVFRKMKRLTGTSPNSFIRTIRLQKAKEILLATDLNISEIAYDLGFTDPNYFSRVFSKEFGMSPRMMRNDLIN